MVEHLLSAESLSKWYHTQSSVALFTASAALLSMINFCQRLCQVRQDHMWTLSLFLRVIEICGVKYKVFMFLAFKSRLCSLPKV